MSPEKNDWVSQVFPYYEMLRILTMYLDLEWWIITLENTDRWHEIRRHQRLNWPIDFDFLYGKREERDRYNEAQIKRVVEKKRISCSTCNGLYSLSVPIFRKGTVIGVLQSGVFLRKTPDRNSLLKQWRDLAGSEVMEFNPAFFKYVRTIMECPVMEGPVYRAFEELMVLYAQVFAGEGDPVTVCRSAAELKVKVFAKHIPQKFWLDVLIKGNRFYPPTWRVGRITEWERLEMGIQRVPDTILAIQIDVTNSLQADDLDLILQNHYFQLEMFKFSKTLPDTVASPLEDYGMLFFFSPEPGRNETQAKLEVLDKIDLISKFAANRLKVKILAGISRCVGAGDDISRVFWEAVTALGFCGPLNRPILFYEDVRKNPTVPVPANFYQMAKRLIEVYTNGVVGEIETVRNEYVVQILAHSAGRPENVRLHFFYVFGQIVDILRKRSPAENQNFLFIFKKLEGELQEMGTIADLITVFRESLKRLIAMTLKPLEASQSIRLEGVRKYIDENFSQNLKLEKVARDNGFSVSVFGRGFKKVMGMSISAYLRKVRLEHAKKLLSSTRLPITQVSQECGFNNLQYFFDVFKRSTGKTPQEFRDSKGRPLSIDT